MSRAAYVKLIRSTLSGFPNIDISKMDMCGYYDALADISIDWMKKKGIPLQERIVLDLGGGTGEHALCLARAGAKVIVADLQVFLVNEGYHRICCDALNLGLSPNSIDIVYCSNLLEHIPPLSHGKLYNEMYRVLRPEGYIYLAWSNWLSPFGGHENSPFHYLGSKGFNWRRRLRSSRGRIVVHDLGVNLFRTCIGSVVREINCSHADLRIVDMVPRYWPWLGFICRVPWVREFLTWNCVILLKKL